MGILSTGRRSDGAERGVSCRGQERRKRHRAWIAICLAAPLEDYQGQAPLLGDTCPELCDGRGLIRGEVRRRLHEESIHCGLGVRCAGSMMWISTMCPSPHAGHTSSEDRKSTRLNSSHLVISYAVFC